MTRRGLATTFAALMTSACSPLALFNRFSPKDAAGKLEARDIAYGPEPRQRLDIYRPRRVDRPAPLLVFFYGGGWDSGSKDLYRWVGRAFAARGFVVAVPDYRLVPHVHFPTFIQDGAAAIAKTQAVATQHGADPDRVFLAGHSAGAYIAMMLALDAAFLQAAGVGQVRVRAAAGLAGPYDFYPFDVPASVNAFGQAPDPQATQPIRYARGDAAPLFLAHGGKDTVVRVRNSTALADAVRSKGGQAEFKLYRDLDHVEIVLALSRPFRGKAPVLDDVVRFLQAHA
ncbi:MAG: alpha/beta hydrolase [Proteobacteria bacterium]|nr:alpha/beta hydrolase [Pseudomonadota bacterium]